MVGGILFDLDGTVYQGNKPIAGAVDFINQFSAKGRLIRFITNRSDRDPEEVAKQLQEMGIECTSEMVITSAMVVANLVADRRVAIIGSKTLVKILKSGRAIITENDPQDVVVGYDPSVNFEAIGLICKFIQSGARYIATNSDSCINSEFGMIPENGAILSAIESVINHTPIVVGKPGTAMIELALKSMGLNAASALVVGDNLKTDIAAANACQLRSVLLLTGVTDEAMVQASRIKPTWCLKDYAELRSLIFS